MFGWKKKKKDKDKDTTKSGSTSSSSGFSSSLNNLLKGSPKLKKAPKNGKTVDILSGGSQTSGSNSPISVTGERSHATHSPASFISNGSASPSLSNNSTNPKPSITSQFVHSLPPPEYSEQPPPDHSLLTPKANRTSDVPSLRDTYTPPPGYGLNQGSRASSSASTISRQTVKSVQNGIDVEFGGDVSASNVSAARSEEGRSKHLSKPLEEWSEAEILDWLNDSDLGYFADIFEGCDIDGDYLSQVTEDDLVDLDVEEASLRKRLLDEIKNLKEEMLGELRGKKAELSEADESDSVHFGDTSDEDLFPDSPKSPALSLLQKPSMTSPVKDKPAEKQQTKGKEGSTKQGEEEGQGQRKRQDSDLSSVLSGASVKSSGSGSSVGQGQQTDKRGSQTHSSVEGSPQGISLSNLPFSRKKVAQWTERDVIHWLDSIHLGHLAQVFIDHEVTGKELVAIDMTLLDEMEIESSLEREKILSTLYDLTNPSSTTARQDVLSVISNASEYEKQKYLAAMSLLQSDDPEDVELLPPEDRDSLLSSPEKSGWEEGQKEELEEEEEEKGEKGIVVDGAGEKERTKSKFTGKMDIEESDESDDDWEDEDDDDDDEEEDEEEDDDMEEMVELMAALQNDEKQNSVSRAGKADVTDEGMSKPGKRRKGSNFSDEGAEEEEKEEEEEIAEICVRQQKSESIRAAQVVTNASDDMKSSDRGPELLKHNAMKQNDTPAKITPPSDTNSVTAVIVEPKDLNQTTSDGKGAAKPIGGTKVEDEMVLNSKRDKTDKVVMNPVIEDSPRTDTRATRSESSRSSGSEKEEKEKKKKGGLSKLKEAISPSNWKKSPRDANALHVWTDVGQTGSTSRTLVVKLTEDSSTRDLISLCLTQLDLVDDPRLYSIRQASTHSRDRGTDRELEPGECPLVVQREWSDHAGNRLEFRQRTAQGGAIKIVLRIPGQPPKGKLISVSLSTPALEVISLALRKFDLKNVDPTLFCLLEVDKDGDVCDVDDEAIPLQLDSHAFVLCDRSNRNLHWTTQEEEEANAGEQAKVKRRDSLVSRASSKMSAISLGSSFGSSELLSSTRIDNEKLSKLEKEMACIEESLVPGKDTSTPSTARDVRATSVSPIPEIKINDREITAEMQEVSKDLEEKDKQLHALQEALGDLGNSYNQIDIDARLQSLEQRLASCPETDSLPEALLQLLAGLEAASQEVEERQREVAEIKQDIELGGGLDDSASSHYEQTLAEVALLKAQYDHSNLLAKMEMAVVDYQLQSIKVEEAKRSSISPRGSSNFYNALPHNQQFSLVSLLASAGSQGFHFQVSAQNNQSGVYIKSCMPASVIRVGDRLVEVNGHSTLGSSVLEVNTLLNRSRKAQLVLLRPGRDREGQEVDRLTSQLATASEHYEACWQENKRLSDIVQRLRPLEHQVLEMSQQKMTMQQLHQDIEALEARNNAISEELRLAHEGNINQSNQAIGRLQGDKERLEMRVRQQDQKLKKFEAEFAQKQSELTTVTQERDEALNSLKSVDLHVNGKVKAGDLIASADNDSPLWEVLKPANKTEILQVLQEEVEEAGRQKQYLDQLYSLMLQNAPELLEQLEQDFDASELSGSEEFC